MRWLGRALVLVVVVFGLVVGLPWGWVQLSGRPRLEVDPNQVPATSVALVMGAATIGGEYPSTYLAARLDRALDLWVTDKADVFIVSGSTSDNEPAVMAKYLVDHGVDPADIIQDEFGNDSYSSCLRAATAYGVEELIIVSQTYHVPRTVATCRALGIDAWGYGDDTMPQNQTWQRYTRRELGANIKAAFDIMNRRDADLWGHDPVVAEAVARHQ